MLVGLLEVDLWQMMLGTAPVAFVTTPCTMAGAFQSMTTPGENNEWNTWSTALTGHINIGNIQYGIFHEYITYCILPIDCLSLAY